MGVPLRKRRKAEIKHVPSPDSTFTVYSIISANATRGQSFLKGTPMEDVLAAVPGDGTVLITQADANGRLSILHDTCGPHSLLDPIRENIKQGIV